MNYYNYKCKCNGSSLVGLLISNNHSMLSSLAFSLLASFELLMGVTLSFLTTFCVSEGPGLLCTGGLSTLTLVATNLDLGVEFWL